MDRELIQKVAWKLYNSSVAGSDFEKTVEVEDLLHAGIQGYLNAERRAYGVNEEVSASFYYKWIYGSIVDFLRKQAMVNLPQKRYGRLKEALAEKRRMERDGHAVSDAELAEKLGWNLSELQNLFATVPKVISVEKSSIGDVDESYNLFDSLVTEQGKAKQLSSALKKEIVELLERCLEQLPRLTLKEGMRLRKKIGFFRFKRT